MQTDENNTSLVKLENKCSDDYSQFREKEMEFRVIKKEILFNINLQ